MTQAALWNILHILAMFIAFAFTTGVGIFLTALARTGDVRTIRAAVKVARPLLTAGAVILVLGLIFGFATAAAIGFSLTAKWLIIAYVLVVLLLVVGIGIHRMWAERLAAAAAASPEEHASPQLTAVIDDRGVSLAGPISGLLWIALIAVMILRPT
jgi:uncharacterized membrane protein